MLFYLDTYFNASIIFFIIQLLYSLFILSIPKDDYHIVANNAKYPKIFKLFFSFLTNYNNSSYLLSIFSKSNKGNSEHKFIIKKHFFSKPYSDYYFFSYSIGYCKHISRYLSIIYGDRFLQFFIRFFNKFFPPKISKKDYSLIDYLMTELKIFKFLYCYAFS